MDRADIINVLYNKDKTPLDFKFESLTAPPLLSLISPAEIKTIHDIAIDPLLNARVDKKFEYFKQILYPKGFRRLAGGTNRIVYKFLEDNRIVIKVGFDAAGITDSPAEFRNQMALAPFVTRVFEVSQCGTIGLFERVQPIRTVQQFASIAEDVYNLLTQCILGEYVLEDIGSERFKNWGLRDKFGPVLLDFPWMYKLDGKKLRCNSLDLATGLRCGGEIDYDDGFNNLICTKCNCIYQAKDLEDKNKNKIIVTNRRGTSEMQISIRRGNECITSTDSMKSVESYRNIINKRENPNEAEPEIAKTVFSTEGNRLGIKITKPSAPERTDISKAYKDLCAELGVEPHPSKNDNSNVAEESSDDEFKASGSTYEEKPAPKKSTSKGSTKSNAKSKSAKPISNPAGAPYPSPELVPPKKFKNDVDEGKYETVDISKYSKEDDDANKEEEDLNIPDIGNDEELYKDPNGRRKAIRVTTSSTKASSPKAKAKQTKSKNDNFKDMEGSF